MDKQSASRLLDETFNKDFEINRFIRFVKELFNDFTVSQKECTKYIATQYKDYISSFEKIGDYENGRKAIEVLVVQLNKTSSRDRARTMQRNFIANWLGKTEKDAALVAFYGDDPQDWRFSFVKMEYKLAEVEPGKVKAVKELTPAKRYSFLVGVNEPNHTCRRQFLELVQQEDINPTLEEIEKAFSIDNVTKEFFLEYKELYLGLKESLEEVIKQDPYVKREFEEKDISTVDFAKKLLGQIVFIYFLQKKGWLGVGKDETGRFKSWGTGPKKFFRKLFDKEIVSYDNFFNDILEPLFYEALATERDNDYYSRFNCKIPFLNGGLFEPINDYDWAGTEIVLDNSVFEKVLTTFDRFNFTVKEDEPLEKEVAIDPEMLGKVFENLLDIKDRKSTGRYYTPREIVHYMCQQSLINYLETNTPISIPRDDIEKFIQLGDFALDLTIRAQEQKKRYHGKTFDIDESLAIPKPIEDNYKEIDRLLKEIKIVDPAVGSGAFPIGMMNEIVKARSLLTLFFDEDEQRKRTVYNFKREAIENSLYGVDIDSSAVDIAKLRFWLSLIVDEEDIKQIKPLPNLDYKIVCGNSLLGVEKNLLNFPLFNKLEELKPLFFNETNARKKQEYKNQIDELISQITNGHKDFDFEVYFSEVFHEKKGFDVVIANPPYNAKLTETERKSFRIKYESVRTGRQDTAAIFVEIAKNIGNEKMQFAYVLPFRLFSRKRNHGQFQIYTLNNFSIKNVLYLGSNVGFSASDEFMILIMSSIFNYNYNNKMKIAFKPSLDKLDDKNIFSELNQSYLIKRNEINLNLAKFDEELLSKIKDKTASLERICHVKDGIVPFIREKLLSDKKIDDRYVRFAGTAGRYVLQKYYFSSEEMYLCYDLNEAKKYIKDIAELRKVQLRKKEIFLHRKILTAQNSAVLKGAIDENKTFVSNSLHSTYLREEFKDKFSLEYILALINSKLMNYYHDSLRLKGTDLHPQILISDLKKLPIKKISSSKQKPFINLVNKIISITRDDDYLDNADKQAKVKKLEEQIDKLVYELYELTPEEIEIVEAFNEEK